MSNPAQIQVSGIPTLHWLKAPGNAVVDGDGVLTMVTGKETDWFNPPPDPSSPTALSNAPALVFPAPTSTNKDWQLSAKVTVDHKYLFDAGTIFVYQGKDDWCKLCFEYSPEKTPTVVSVVTKDISDDANGTTIEGNCVTLRVSKYGTVIAFHYSVNDGDYWTLHRVFSMRDPDAPMSIGFLAQAPTGESCKAQFSNIRFTETTLSNLRDGT